MKFFSIFPKNFYRTWDLWNINEFSEGKRFLWSSLKNMGLSILSIQKWLHSKGPGSLWHTHVYCILQELCNPQGFLFQEIVDHETLLRCISGASCSMKGAVETCVYESPESLWDWEMSCLLIPQRSHFSCSSQPRTLSSQNGLGPGGFILLRSSSLEKEAKDTVTAHTLGDTKVNHIQVNFLKVKTFFFDICILLLFYIGQRAFRDK